MKKLLIGCGCLVVLGIAALGWVFYQYAPAVQQIVERAEVAQQRMAELDAQHPFDPETVVELDAERFARTLELRLALIDEYSRWETGMDAYGEDADWSWSNFIEKSTGAMDHVSEQFELLPDALQGEGMGPTEFVWYARVLWATLDSVAAGAGGPELDPLRGQYDTMRGAYGEVRKQDNQLPPTFEQLVGEIDPAFVLTARQVLASDPNRVEQALGDPGMEVLLLRVPEMISTFLEVEVGGADVTPSQPTQPAPGEPR